VDGDNPHFQDPSVLLADEYANFERQTSCANAEEYAYLMGLLEPARINHHSITPHTQFEFNSV
jgi:hypothetical protein